MAAARLSAAQKRSPLDRERARLYWPFVLPALAVYVLLFLGPAFSGVYISLTRWGGAGAMTFIGFQNYSNLFSDSVFLESFVNTFVIVALCGVAVFALDFAIIILLRDTKRGRSVRTILFAPYMISPVAISIALGLFLAPSGLANGSLRALGLNGLALNWLSSDLIFQTALVEIVWVSTGYFAVILFAGVDRIPRDFRDDCLINGATVLQEFRYVTLPLIWDVVSVTAVLWTISTIGMFTLIFALVGIADLVPLSARTMAIEQYYTAMGGFSPEFEFGYACAMGVVMVLCVVVLVVLLRRVMRRDRLEY